MEDVLGKQLGTKPLYLHVCLQYQYWFHHLSLLLVEINFLPVSMVGNGLWWTVK
jgi:hypothetical protein